MEQLKQLENRIEELKKWKQERTTERFKFPLDFTSRSLVSRANIIFTGRTFNTNNVQFTDFIGGAMLIQIKNVTEPLYYKNVVYTRPLNTFSVNTSTNIFTYSGPDIVKDGDIVYFTSGGVLPLDSTLSTLSTTGYYIINSGSGTFKISTSLGGSEVDITSAGTGTHYFAKT